MKRLSPAQRRHLISRARNELSKVKRRSDLAYVPSPKFGARPTRYDYINVKVPTIFNLQYENVNKVLEFISVIKSIARSRKHGLFVDLENVSEIGEGAIGMLMTVIDEFSDNNIPVAGNQPKDAFASDILERSGFFSYVQGVKVKDGNRITKNTIFRVGTVNKSQLFLPKIVHEAMETVWGIKGRNQLLYTVAFEMVRNACDHAFKRQKETKWYMVVTHLEAENIVKFSFVDNGKGILKTLNDGRLAQFRHIFTDNADVLTTAFKNGIKSRTGLSWRGKGLPTIYENFEENYIKNLIVISNDVYLDFERGIFAKLSTPFSGTYYYWIVNNECERVCFPLV